MRPPAMRSGGSRSPMIAAPVSDLPAPDSPTTPKHLARRDLEADIVDREQRRAASASLRNLGDDRLEERLGKFSAWLIAASD
jgi:hypothetical protein